MSQRAARENQGPIAGDITAIHNPHMTKIETVEDADIGVENDRVGATTAFFIGGPDIEEFKDDLRAVASELGYAPKPQEFTELSDKFDHTDVRIYYNNWFTALADLNLDPNTNPDWTDQQIPETTEGKTGRFIQMYTGIMFGRDTVRTWDENAAIESGIVKPGSEEHVAPVNNEHSYVAWRRSEAADIGMERSIPDPIPSDYWTARELFSVDDDGNSGYEIAVQPEDGFLQNMVFDAESEEELFDRLDTLASGMDQEPDSVNNVVEPAADPKTEADVTQATAGYFWRQLVGHDIQKLALRADGKYEYVETANYEFIDESKPMLGVERTD